MRPAGVIAKPDKGKRKYKLYKHKRNMDIDSSRLAHYEK